MFTSKEVIYTANLSRIHVDDADINNFAQNLGNILHYIDQLKSLDVSSVEPTSHVIALKNVYREDTVKPSLTQPEVKQMASHFEQGSFLVPKVIE